MLRDDGCGKKSSKIKMLSFKKHVAHTKTSESDFTDFQGPWGSKI